MRSFRSDGKQPCRPEITLAGPEQNRPRHVNAGSLDDPGHPPIDACL